MKVPLTPIPLKLLEPEPIRTFRIEYPDGELVEFDARVSEVRQEPCEDGGFTLSMPLSVKGTVRTGSIYDCEGAD